MFRFENFAFGLWKWSLFFFSFLFYVYLLKIILFFFFLYLCVRCCCLDEEQTLIESKERSKPKPKTIANRGHMQKRAHTIDDFMTGKKVIFFIVALFSNWNLTIFFGNYFTQTLILLLCYHLTKVMRISFILILFWIK